MTVKQEYGGSVGVPSGRQANRPDRPNPSIYDPRQWQVLPDVDDGSWVSKVREKEGLVQPVIDVETGFMPWDKQETRFPYLDQRIYLHDVSAPNPLVWRPDTVNIQVWDPANRAIAEPRTKNRHPISLNPITTHSLARWVPSEDAQEFPLEPEVLPHNPATEDKKRPLPSTSLIMGKAALATKPTKKKQQANPSKESPPPQAHGQSATVASVHYPLKSPGATDLSNPAMLGSNDQGTASFAIVKSHEMAGPPTPYPRDLSSFPDTPTVALYDRPMADDDISSTGSEDSEWNGHLALMEDFRRGGAQQSSQFQPATPGLSSSGGRKRPAQLDLSRSTANHEVGKKGKKRRVTQTSASTQPMSASSISSSLNTNRSDWSQDDLKSFLVSRPGGGLGNEYDEEELRTAHPLLAREYREAREDLARAGQTLRDMYSPNEEDLADLSAAVNEHRRADDRFANAASQLKVALNKESAQRTAEARDAATAVGPSKGQVNPYHPHNIPQSIPGPNKVTSRSKVEYQPKPKGKGKSVRFAGLENSEKPNDMLKYQAGRAIGRYGLTSMRRGSFRV
ncbi:hypothetical protein F5Y16DRAFT_104196 [Xylariaceae sp. FL0255]|nr:hypothetical protein F5Y16DRAFT_104196 [Xylariaceae sp. FL0255]